MAELSRFEHVGPHFVVRDVVQATSFYEDVLGFEVEYIDGDPPRYVVVFRDEVYIHLSLSDDPDFRPGGGRAFVAVQGVDALWHEVCSRAEGSACGSLEDRDYGHGVRFRGFEIADPDSNVLRIGEPLNGPHHG